MLDYPGGKKLKVGLRTDVDDWTRSRGESSTLTSLVLGLLGCPGVIRSDKLCLD
jgi:hypothetical protein